ncbi:MAG TPA: hypothetical protein VNP02_00115, partial [Gammaproteobacteria bacterium]|nr:hypothetical protein [Gammaproteobacteria bacterium]
AKLRRAYEATVPGDPNQRRDIGLWAGHYGDSKFAFEAMRAATEERAVLIAYAWLPQLADMRKLPEFKTYLREIGMVDYWKDYGFPDICREVGEDDFKCD